MDKYKYHTIKCNKFSKWFIKLWKLTSKNTSNGYCGLNNGLINTVNIPNLPESLITKLTLDLSNKAHLISGYSKSS